MYYCLVGLAAVINHRHCFQLTDYQINLILHSQIIILVAQADLDHRGQILAQCTQWGVAPGPAKEPPLAGAGHRGQIAVMDMISPLMSMWLVFK